MAKRYYSATAARAKLTSTVTSGATTIQVDTVSGFPANTPFTLILERDTIREEVVDVTGVAGTTLTVTRGVDSTPAVEHAANAVVEHGVSARDHRESNDHVNATSGVHGIVGSLQTYIDTAEADANTYTDTQVGLDRTRLTALEGRADVHDHSTNTTGGNIPQGSVTGLTAALDAKAPLDSPTFTGNVVVPTADADGEAVNKEQMDTALVAKANLTGAVFSGVVSVPNGTTATHAVNKSQLDTKAPLANPTFTGNVVVPTADANGEAVNKGQMDTAITDANNAQVRARADGGALQAVKIVAGSTAVTTGSDGRQNVSFGHTFNSLIGVVVSWGAPDNVPGGGFATAYAPYVVSATASQFTFGGGASLANMRINWVAYGT